MTTANVAELPRCNFCHKTARFDGATTMGPWAYMCSYHFKEHGVGLGTGKGQLLIVK